MKINKKPWPISTISNARGIRQRIDTNPDFQRPAVWTTAQKQLLIDTILREYDVPKMYWRKLPGSPDRYEVVDGQQRLRAIWAFFDGSFNLGKDAEDIDGISIKGCTYETLHDDLRIRFDSYPVDVVVLEETDEDEVREMFLRLQNGTSLKAQEKRNAMTGAMREFVRSLTQHEFFSRVAFENSRFNHDLVAAQTVCLELAGEPVNIKSADLTRMYQINQNFDVQGPKAKSIRRTFSILASIFPEKTPELERYNVIALYCVLSELQRVYAFDYIKPHLHDWFLKFEERRREQDKLDDESGDAGWVSYREHISHSTDSQDSIRSRMEFMLRHLLQAFPGLPLKDNQRNFTHVQKLAIFRRDKQTCQLRIKCDGVRVEWDNWHCDHIHPWSKGGATTVKNGQVACPACNLAKGNDVLDSLVSPSLTTSNVIGEDMAYPLANISPETNEVIVAESDEDGSNGKRKISSAAKAPRTGLYIEFSDGTLIAENTAADTFAKALEKIGLDLVGKLGINVNNFPLVSKQREPKYQQTPIGEYYIMTHSNTMSKKHQLERIASELNVGLTVKVSSGCN